ncbi:MAG: hypothetical protein V4726_22365 [Verrucomicrobiota bacterium]
MKALETGFALFLALAIGGGSALWLSHSGLGAVELLVMGALLTTAIFSLLGGRWRILFAAIAVVPPFIALSVINLRFAVARQPAWEAFVDSFAPLLAAFGLFVAFPLTLVSIVHFCLYGRRPPSGPGTDSAIAEALLQEETDRIGQSFENLPNASVRPDLVNPSRPAITIEPLFTAPFPSELEETGMNRLAEAIEDDGISGKLLPLPRPHVEESPRGMK